MMNEKEQIEKALFTDTSSYQDIMDSPRSQSRAHLPMPRADRAAQFSPFAALTGYHELLNKIGDRYKNKNYSPVNKGRHLRAQLALIERQKTHPQLKIEYFNGKTGFYEQYIGYLRQVNHHTHKLIFEDGQAIIIQNIRHIVET